VKDAIVARLKIKNIIESNANIVKEMSEGKFKKEQFYKFGKDNGLESKEIILKDIKDDSIFTDGMVKEIFKLRDDELQLVTDSMLTKNYIIYSKETKILPFDKNVKDYQQYKNKAKLKLSGQIFSFFDRSVNDKYNIEINQKVLDRIKNTL
ncbi:hypothetical protein OAB59_04255, partial [Pelagibacteraceae bacterium]|nr:hypothetical protein [Pelagibacteraceae bacterium]